ncbi:MAG: CDP-glycerol glycerophosphotransferase family protein [Anaerostipes sp.]|jgi:CDP-glycerol glycerophosphotransferase (TagB/SpsB family)
MINKIIGKFKKKSINKDKIAIYREVSAKKDVDASLVLLEGGQGKNYNGNMFYLLKEIEENPLWKDKMPIYVSSEEKLDATKKFLSNYNFHKVKVVVRDTKEYARYLAKAKYLFTDNSFPTYMVKRPEQVYVNTWHGTPIKYLGISDLVNATSLPNIQKNYFMCDYALFPNEHTRDVFLKDYDLENYMSGKCLMCDYPRNDAFHEGSPKVSEVKKIAYLPTWRGSGRNANIKEQKKIVTEFLSEIDGKLADNQMLYVNLHFLVGNDMDFSVYKHIESFPSEKETYDFLKDCDLLISDYSSVTFDFAVSGKPIILYAYDKKEYEEKKGTYFSIDDLPFPIVQTVDDLIESIHHVQNKDLTEFNKKFCCYKKNHTTEAILKLIFNSEKGSLLIEDAVTNEKKNLYVYGHTLGNAMNKKALSNYLATIDQNKYNVMLGFRGKITQAKFVFFTKQLPENIKIHQIVNRYTFSEDEQRNIQERRKDKTVEQGTLKEAFEYQRKRLLGEMRIDEFVQYNLDGSKMVDSFSTISCPKTLFILPYEIMGYEKKFHPFSFNVEIAAKYYDETVDLRNRDFSNEIIEDNEETQNQRKKYFNNAMKYQFLTAKSFWKKDIFCSIALCKYISAKEINQREMWIEIENEPVESKFLWKKGIPWFDHYRLNLCIFKLPLNVIKDMRLNSRVRVRWDDVKKRGCEARIEFGKEMNSYKISSLRILRKINRTIYFRATDSGNFAFTVRPINYTDSKIERVKMLLAFLCAKLMKQKNYITLFEKNSARYEESASVLYEKLIDEKYENIYFILEEEYFKKHREDIENKYQDDIVKRYSWKHYFLFFVSKTFISSESVGHAIETRCSSKVGRKRLVDNQFNYIFLQHGVMYMISLDSISRKMFNQLPNKAAQYRVVVSSKLEAEHFINLGKHKIEHIYETGLCKFDKNKWNKDADRIVIMPTWRPWEYNDAEVDLMQTNYYRMLLRMIGAVPNELQDKLYVLPHPLIGEMFRTGKNKLAKYLPDPDLKYDTILQNTKVLITDYSSISYDAFYRGANTIFYWEELNECLEAYGDYTKLMLNKDNIFGDICYNEKELNSSIQSNYFENQNEHYVRNYNQIVAFHDGKNTERVIQCLKEDGFIKK